MKENILFNFFRCGLLGWCLECFFTGLASLISHRDRRFLCSTSLWMFPIYGLAAFILPIYKFLGSANILTRGGIYTIVIFVVEYVSGYLLRKINACPWDYSNARFNINGLIRLDYAPAWFLVGLLFEWYLTKGI